MSALIDTMFYVGAIPWHGLGKKIDENAYQSPGQALVNAGCDWEVGVKPIQTVDNEPLPGYATYRKDTGDILGMVGPRYHILQNEDLFDKFRPFVEAGEAHFHTAGSLDGGKRIWALCQINRAPSEIAPGDEVAKFIMLSNCHDGGQSVRVGFTPIRIVCANTLAMAHNSDASKLIRIRHTSKMQITLDRVIETMNLANQEFEATAEQFRFLASRTVNSRDLRKFVKIMLGVEKTSDAELKTRTRNTIEDIEARFESGLGQTNPKVRGTWWAAYCGYNEYLNYSKGRNKENRLNSLWFGTSFADNVKALETAMAMAA